MVDKLNFLVKEDLWLAAEQEPFKILGWTTKRPQFDNGHIRKNTALIFNHMYLDALNFLMTIPGSEHEEWCAEFNQPELESLTKEGALEIIQMNEVVETNIVPGFPDIFQAPILMRESRSFEFSKEAILPKDIFITMGQRENFQSKGEIVPGEKISLRHLLDVYSTAVGQRLILK